MKNISKFNNLILLRSISHKPHQLIFLKKNPQTLQASTGFWTQLQLGLAVFSSNSVHDTVVSYASADRFTSEAIWCKVQPK